MPDHSPVLVVAAHPDDEVLGCGGTLARLVKEGREVHIAIMGEGITSRHRHREAADATQVSLLHGHAEVAAREIGASDVVFFKLPDNRLDTVPLLDVVKLVEELVQKFNPEIIYTPHPGDLNVDHSVVHRAVITATRPVSDHVVREILALEVPSSTEWSFQRFGPSFRPNVFEDVSNTLETKIAALSCYETETRRFPHPRSPEALRAIAARWGSVAGCQAAEAFELVRSIRKANLRR